MRITRAWAVALLGLPIAFVLAFFVIPLGVVLLDSFRTNAGMWTLEHYAKAMGELYYWETLLLTFKLSFYVTLATFVIGYPLAYYVVRHVNSRLICSLLYIVVVTPLFTSNIVRAFGWEEFRDRLS